ncbi:MAG: FAD-dependent oxidoreductase [Bacteroidetes bacterium]|uniref:FAD-dependent oxidoreductase n=1 Tax=Candidatus Cryptobacteroides merdavium TaxID=2840769 RepID=A0A9D9HC24_9BACT|nr:FAD-dependent oxidoreductase [Candidatus Cryptobacteroides merdavium]
MKNYDVIVAGAGPAGICTAVAAARQGAHVALVERYGIVGGNLTAGYVGPILGSVSSGTMRDEICGILGVKDNDWIGRIGLVHDFEKAKLVLEEFIAAEQNIDVYLQCCVYDVIKDDDRIRGLICASNEGHLEFYASVVVDCTGDGIVSSLAGAEIRKGREDGLMQPVTLEFTVDGVDEDRGLICIGDVDDVELDGRRFLDWCREKAEDGKLPLNLAAVRLHPCVTNGQRQVNTTQVNGIDITKTEQIFKADLELRRQICLVTEFLKEYLPGYENVRVIGSGATTGVRESRRVVGDYVIDADDLIVGRHFDDAVVHNALFIVDIHNPAGAGQAEGKIQYCRPYDLPYRALLPKGIEGLLVAGRCISGTHRAHASYRVMSICMAMGEAAGIAAALSAKAGCTPRQLDVAQLQEVMTDVGIQLFE